jgi:4-hydroxybenzoate polyprenyltransferase
MKLAALFALGAGAFVALGRLTAAQWHAAGVALLFLTLAHGLTVLPWLLAALFALLWWRQRKRTDHWIDRSIEVGARQFAAPRKQVKR